MARFDFVRLLEEDGETSRCTRGMHRDVWERATLTVLSTILRLTL